MPGAGFLSMQHNSLIWRLLRHTGMALGILVIAMLFMEAAAPGSVMPYIDPLPLGVLALLLLAFDAYIATASRRFYLACSLTGASVAGLALVVMIGYGGGRSDALAGILLLALLAGSFGFAAWPEKES